MTGTLNAACHCGTVRLRVTLLDGIASARRCTCSYCRMRGAVPVSAALGAVEIAAGAEALTEYRFNTGAARHFFCRICGIYTHHQRRSNLEQYGVNVACLEGMSPFDFAAVPVLDGVRHPADDTGGTLRLAGTLHYEQAAADDAETFPKPVLIASLTRRHRTPTSGSRVRKRDNSRALLRKARPSVIKS